MSHTRREFLAAGAASAAALTIGGRVLPQALGAPEREIAVRPALVVLFLRGGQDQLNAIVPYGDGRYRDLRPNIAVAEPGQENGALDLDGTFGLHPALAGFKRLYDEGLLAPIVNAGSPHPTRSHFDAQDFMEYGAPGDRSVHSGWLNRYLAATASGSGTELRALAMQGRLPRSLRGDHPVLAVPESLLRPRGGATGFEEDVLDLFDPLYQAPPSLERPGTMGERTDEDDLTRTGRATIATLRRLQEILASRPAGPEAAYPPEAGRLGQQLRQVARVLKAGQGLQVVGLDWNGWDHHINQGETRPNRTFWDMLVRLDAAVSAFYEDVRAMRSQVVLLIQTEFGRTNAENGNRGTDHGHGGPMWVVGGKLNGGRVYGDWPGLEPRATYQGRDLVVTTDFRTVCTEILRDHMGLHPSKRLFPDWPAAPAERRLGLFS